jgi:hypothetical protein
MGNRGTAKDLKHLAEQCQELSVTNHNGRYRIHNGLNIDYFQSNVLFTGTIAECVVWLTGYRVAQTLTVKNAIAKDVVYHIRSRHRAVRMRGTLIQARRVAIDFCADTGAEDVAIWYSFFGHLTMVEPLLDYELEGMIVADAYDYGDILEDSGLYFTKVEE